MTPPLGLLAGCCNGMRCSHAYSTFGLARQSRCQKIYSKSQQGPTMAACWGHLCANSGPPPACRSRCREDTSLDARHRAPQSLHLLCHCISSMLSLLVLSLCLPFPHCTTLLSNFYSLITLAHLALPPITLTCPINPRSKCLNADRRWQAVLATRIVPRGCLHAHGKLPAHFLVWISGQVASCLSRLFFSSQGRRNLLDKSKRS